MSFLDTVSSALSTDLSGKLVSHVELVITINGADITKMFPPLNEISLRYEDTISFKSDNLELICPDINDLLINSPIIKKGANLRVIIHQWNRTYPGEHVALDTGKFEIDIVEQTGPPTEIRISATSVPISGTLKLTPQTTTWKDETLHTLMVKIAQRNGLNPVWSVQDTSLDRKIASVQQNFESDLHLLERICHANGLCMKLMGNQDLVVFSEQEWEKKPAVATLDFGISDQWGLIKWKLTSQSQDVYQKGEIAYTNTEAGSTTGGDYTLSDPNTTGTGEIAKSTTTPGYEPSQASEVPSDDPDPD